ncbi:DUF2285 domain-containing protein [Sphingobium sp. OAS761]|uniref:DNA -binding domain-containing protein n=1 Tax=Sphingobium sp. OAS761 TaxID=2817901 RepID=UPI00346099D7
MGSLLPCHGRVERRRESVMRPRPTLQPELLPEPPYSDGLTDYDYRLLIVYLRLLDAEADGADWADVARIVLHLDPADKPREARAVHAAHLKRARWMRDHGHRKLLTDAMNNVRPCDR